MRKLVSTSAFLFLGLVFTLMTPVVVADQKDSQLQPLFDELAATPSQTHAYTVAGKIWEIWIHHDDPEVSRFMNIGISAMSQNDTQVAFDAFDTVVSIAPDFAEGWNKRATVNYMMNRLDASMHDIQKTLTLEPRHFGALSGMGLIFDAIDKPGAAADAWERALGVHPHIRGAREHIEYLRAKEKGRRT